MQVCPYCRKKVLPPFSIGDHYYSNVECGKQARAAKTYEGPISQLVMF